VLPLAEHRRILSTAEGIQAFFMVANGATHEKDILASKDARAALPSSDLEGRGGFAIQGPKALRY